MVVFISWIVLWLILVLRCDGFGMVLREVIVFVIVMMYVVEFRVGVFGC